MSVKVFASDFKKESSKWQWSIAGQPIDIANLTKNQLSSAGRILMKEAHRLHTQFGNEKTDWEYFVHPLYWALKEEKSRRNKINEWIGAK